MFREKCLLIDYKMLKMLKEKVKNEEDYYNLLKEEGVDHFVIYHYDGMITWLDKYDFLPCLKNN